MGIRRAIGPISAENTTRGTITGMTTQEGDGSQNESRIFILAKDATKKY